MGVVGGEGGFTFVNRFNFLKLVFLFYFVFLKQKTFLKNFPLEKRHRATRLKIKPPPK